MKVKENAMIMEIYVRAHNTRRQPKNARRTFVEIVRKRRSICRASMRVDVLIRMDDDLAYAVFVELTLNC